MTTKPQTNVCGRGDGPEIPEKLLRVRNWKTRPIWLMPSPRSPNSICESTDLPLLNATYNVSHFARRSFTLLILILVLLTENSVNSDDELLWPLGATNICRRAVT